MESGGNYGEARSSQENKNLLKKIDDSLKDDQKIDNTEAKEIQNEYKKLKSNIIAITKEELASFAKGLDLEESASLGKTLNKLKEKSSESITPETGKNSPGESTPTQVVNPETTEGESTTVESNINKAEIISYFDIKNSETLTKGLEESGLNLFKMLDGYKDYIENDLKGLDSTITKKIKKSILIKTGLINGVIEELREDNKDNDIHFKNNRWILNEQITDLFETINTEILPSAFFLHKYKKSNDQNTFLQKSIKGVYKQKRRGSHAIDETNIINIKLSEIQEMFSANLDDEGNFDEGFFSTQDVLGTGNKNDSNILKNIGFDDSGISEISLLSEADKKIEADIMIKYMAFVGFMMIPYAGATASIPSDLIDLFSSTEGTITMMKTLGFIQDDYEMSKSWVDNAFGAIGIVGSIFGIQAIAKGKKLVKVTSKLNKLGVSSSDIAIRIKEETKILKAKFGNGDDILKGAENFKQIDEKGLKNLRLIFHPDVLQSKGLGKLGNKITQNINELKQSGKKGDLEKLSLIYSSIEKGDIQTLKRIFNLNEEEMVGLNKILDNQTKIPKIEQLPVLRFEQLPISIKEVEGISDIKNPELIKEFSEKIYEPLLDIKKSSKTAEAEIIEPKIVENISKLDNILDNIDNLKQSFKLKGEKISDLFSKTLEGIKNYILGLKKSLKIKLVKTPKIKGKIGEIITEDFTVYDNFYIGGKKYMTLLNEGDSKIEGFTEIIIDGKKVKLPHNGEIRSGELYIKAGHRGLVIVKRSDGQSIYKKSKYFPIEGGEQFKVTDFGVNIGRENKQVERMGDYTIVKFSSELQKQVSEYGSNMSDSYSELGRNTGLFDVGKNINALGITDEKGGLNGLLGIMLSEKGIASKYTGALTDGGKGGGLLKDTFAGLHGPYFVIKNSGDKNSYEYVLPDSKGIEILIDALDEMVKIGEMSKNERKFILGRTYTYSEFVESRKSDIAGTMY